MSSLAERLLELAMQADDTEARHRDESIALRVRIKELEAIIAEHDEPAALARQAGQWGRTVRSILRRTGLVIVPNEPETPS